eukprot:15897041-Heterocapsa_arctica.AAC.1
MGGRKYGNVDRICNKCGRWGHRAVECRFFMALDDDTHDCVNTRVEVLSVDKFSSSAGVLVMIDNLIHLADALLLLTEVGAKPFPRKYKVSSRQDTKNI